MSSDTSPSPLAPAASKTPPTDPEALVIWAQTPEGIAFFEALNRQMSKGVPADPGPGLVEVVSEEKAGDQEGVS